MARPVEDWDENDVLGLPVGENDSFERKGSKKLDLTVSGVKEPEVLNELAKQLSAFSNAGGGQIVYGVADDGTVEDGGVALSVKGRQSTKEWLEDVIPTLTEFEIVGFNVYPITPGSGTSKIAAGKALFIVDIPDSDRAPHQSTRDMRYYVRLGGKSHPAPHRMIEDIRNRQKHPVLDATIKAAVTRLPNFDLRVQEARFEGEFIVTVQIHVTNVGRLIAQDTCLRLHTPPSFSLNGYDNQSVRLRGASNVVPRFLELIDPVYPGMELEFWTQFNVPATLASSRSSAVAGGPWILGGEEIDRCQIAWSLFADSAPAREKDATMAQLGFNEAARMALDQHPQAVYIRMLYAVLR